MAMQDPIFRNSGGARAPSPLASKGDRISYPGSKAGAGVFQTIINQIPPHEVFIEAFAGSGQVTLRLKPARATIVIDIDAAVIEDWRSVPGVTAICADAVPWLAANQLAPGTVVYCDPPYLRQVRSNRVRYAHEFDTEKDHAGLLEVLRGLKVPVLLSGYRSALYDQRLADWRRIDYRIMTHGGPRVESLWCNFPEPFALHDYRYLGQNFRQREQIKHMKARWRRRLLLMPRLRRLAILETIMDLQNVAGGQVEISGQASLKNGNGNELENAACQSLSRVAV